MTSVRLERWIARKFRLRHVELIAALYECRSILKASRRLNLTQPTLTKALQDVEATLDLRLFERTNRGLEPTPYGEIFARHAKIVLAQLRHAAEELENLRVGYSGKVTVGTLLAASASVLPDASARPPAGGGPQQRAVLRGVLLRADLPGHAARAPAVAQAAAGAARPGERGVAAATAGDRAAASGRARVPRGARTAPQERD